MQVPAEPIAELEGVEKRFGGVRALAGVDLAIHRGELVALLGPNGAGKTTAIGILLGLRRPTRGEARLFGGPPTALATRARCGAMLQDAGVPPLLTVEEILVTHRSCFASPRPLDEVLAMADLADRRRIRACELSGGQLRRLLFALAVCGDPELLFLDEPTAGMDVESRRTFLAEIRRFVDAGGTAVLTTHHLEEADELAERIVVLHRGVVIADASPERIKAMVPGRRLSFRAERALTPTDFDGLPIERLGFGGPCTARFLCADPAAVLIELARRGIDAHDLEVVGADLEDAFLTLTGRAAPPREDAR